MAAAAARSAHRSALHTSAVRSAADHRAALRRSPIGCCSVRPAQSSPNAGARPAFHPFRASRRVPEELLVLPPSRELRLHLCELYFDAVEHLKDLLAALLLIYLNEVRGDRCREHG
jgi:hypothetical protein